MKKKQSFEVLILGVLAIILFSYLSAVYLIKPINAEIEELNRTIAAKEAEITSAFYTVSAYDAKGNRLKSLKKELIKGTDKFYAIMSETTYLNLIDDNIQNHDITFLSLTADDTPFKASDLSSDKNTAEMICSVLSEDSKINYSTTLKNGKFDSFFEKLQAKGGQFETEVCNTAITLEAEGKYEDILSMIQSILKAGKSIVCNSMTLDIPENVSLKADPNPNVRLVLTLSFVSVPNIAEHYEVKDPKELPQYSFPMDVINGSYRSTENILTFIRRIIG